MNGPRQDSSVSDERLQPEQWRDEFVLSRDIREVGAKSQHYRDFEAGRLVQLARGAYRDAGRTVTDDERYLELIRARALVSRSAPVFSHLSAARIWGLPILGYWPEIVHVEVGNSRNGRSIPGLRRHRSTRDDAITWRGGLLVTSLARTVADLASTTRLETAVIVVDAALHGQRDLEGRSLRAPLAQQALEAELADRANSRGIRQLAWAVAFGDGLSESPGESVSRLTMHRIGCPPPVLQQTFTDNNRFVATTDFWWPDYNLTGEFDGRGKYLREELTAGKTAAEVVVDEKVREDRVRALGPRMTRWVWEEARSPRDLRLKLTRAGLPCTR